MQTKKTIIFGTLLLVIGLPLFIYGSNEIDEAVSWLYQNGLTKYTNATMFKSNNTIRRDEASKLFSVFAKTILERPNVATNQTCTRFSDLPANNTMKSFVFDACTRGYILGNNNRFSPAASLSNEQAIVIIIRMLEGKKDESGTPRSTEYYKSAQELGLLEGLDLIKNTRSITRGKLGILLYRVSNLSDIDTYIQQNNVDISSATKPDLIINSLSLDATYPSPKVGDQAPYIKATIKNIGSSITFSSTNKMILSCGSAIKKEITNGTLGTNQSMTIEGLTNLLGTYPDMFVEAKDNYTINCNVSLQSSTVYENNENNNNKSFFISVGKSTSGPDFVITSLILDPAYSNPKANDENVHLIMNVKNIGSTMNFASNNKATISCSNNVQIINKQITSGTLGKNESWDISLSNIYDSNTYLFLAPEKNYHINCTFLPANNNSTPELVVNEKNYKDIYFDVN